MPQFNTPINTNDQSIDRVLANPLPVLLALFNGSADLVATKALEDVARAEAGKLIVARVNTAENPNTARRFGAQSGTTIVTWKGGKEQARVDGPAPEQIRAAADHLLGRGPAPRTEPHTSPHTAPRTERRTTGAAQYGGTHTSTSTEPITVNQANFEQEVLRSAEPVLVDFWAPWCGPCRMVAPTLEKLAREYAGRLKIAKLNVDQNPQLAAQYGAHSIPLMVMFKRGLPVNKILGAHPEPSIRSFVERELR